MHVGGNFPETRSLLAFPEIGCCRWRNGTTKRHSSGPFQDGAASGGTPWIGAKRDIVYAASATVWKGGRQFQGVSSSQRAAGQSPAILAMTSAI